MNTLEISNPVNSSGSQVMEMFIHFNVMFSKQIIACLSMSILPQLKVKLIIQVFTVRDWN